MKYRIILEEAVVFGAVTYTHLYTVQRYESNEWVFLGSTTSFNDAKKIIGLFGNKKEGKVNVVYEEEI